MNSLRKRTVAREQLLKSGVSASLRRFFAAKSGILSAMAIFRQLPQSSGVMEKQFIGYRSE